MILFVEVGQVDQVEVEVERVPGLLTYHFYVLYDCDRVRMFRDLESETYIYSVSTDRIDLPYHQKRFSSFVHVRARYGLLPR